MRTLITIAKMRSKSFVQALVMWLGLAYFSNAQSLSCPSITINDLGSTTEFSTNGLVARAIVPPGEIGIVPVRIRNFTHRLYILIYALP